MGMENHLASENRSLNLVTRADTWHGPVASIAFGIFLRLARATYGGGVSAGIEREAHLGIVI
jgi:hypothetical protein